MAETRLPKVGERVRFRDYVERFPTCLFHPGRTAVVVAADDDAIYARVDDMTPKEAAPLAEWDGCVQWSGDPPCDEDEERTLLSWFWDECEVLGE